MNDQGGTRVTHAGRRAATASTITSLLFGIALVAIGCTPLVSGSSSEPSHGKRITMTSFAPLVQEVLPAVVNVSAVQKPGKTAANKDTSVEINPVNDPQATAGLPPSELDELRKHAAWAAGSSVWVG